MLAASSGAAPGAGAAELGLSSAEQTLSAFPSLVGAGDDRIGADSACGLAAGAASALMVLHRRWGQQVQRVYAAGSADFLARAGQQQVQRITKAELKAEACLLYTSPSPRDATLSRMPSSA